MRMRDNWKLRDYMEARLESLSLPHASDDIARQQIRWRKCIASERGAYVQIHSYMCICIRKYIHMYIYTYTNTYVYICV